MKRDVPRRRFHALLERSSRESLGISADSGKRWSKKFFAGSFANYFFRTRLKRKGDLDMFMFFLFAAKKTRTGKFTKIWGWNDSSRRSLNISET